MKPPEWFGPALAKAQAEDRRMKAFNDWWTQFTKGVDSTMFGHFTETDKQMFLSCWQAASLPPEHEKFIAGFLLEMYQTMVDPVEEFHGTIKELCELLLERAREDRQAIWDLDRSS